jgi:hypothetical protein
MELRDGNMPTNQAQGTREQQATKVVSPCQSQVPGTESDSGNQMRFWHDPLLAGLSMVLIILLLVWCGKRSAKPGHGDMARQVQAGLINLYDNAEATEVADGGKKPVTGDSLWDAYLMVASENPPVSILPGYIESSDVFFSEGKPGSRKLLCVVRLDDGELYGITGSREVRKVGLDEFAEWPHITGSSIVVWNGSSSLPWDLVLLKWYLRIALVLAFTASMVIVYLRQKHIEWQPFGIPSKVFVTGLGPMLLFWPIALAVLIYYWRSDGWHVVRDEAKGVVNREAGDGEMHV